ncbi:hypothetical protein DRQ53_13555 [bacterium]|nr:MAG: hypothetical protein DRQ53_13555 [bacterium]
MSRAPILLLVVLPFLPQACNAPQPSPDLLTPTESQIRLRSFQSKVIELRDRKRVMRGVISVLQDLGFIIERANEPLGLVTAARFAEPNFNDLVAVTVTVRQHEGRHLLVRANAVFNNRPVEDPETYQRFFAALERSLFIDRP